MGAASFMTKAKGATAAEAFDEAVAAARHENGHGGYSGTIAEKRSFKIIAVPAGRDAWEFACADETLDRFDDKWGPAGCVRLGPTEWVFFGVASC